MNAETKNVPQTSRDHSSTREDETTIQYETIPGEQPPANSNQALHRSRDGKTAPSMTDEDLN